MSFQQSLNEWSDKIAAYFAQLSDYEKYGWIVESAGIVCIIVGLVLFFF